MLTRLNRSVKTSLFLAALTLLGPLVAVVAFALNHSEGGAAGPIELGADTDTSGNSAGSLSTTQGCISVHEGDKFKFDIFVADVQLLKAWEMYFRFDPDVLKVEDADLWQFLGSNPYSSLTMLSEPLFGGRYFIGAADINDAPESGSGVLARVNMEATGEGVSPIEIFSEDRNGDGKVDLGPRLTAESGAPLGDVDGDGVFDGPTHHALVAVNTSCNGLTPTPTLPPPEDEPGEGTPAADSTPAADGTPAASNGTPGASGTPGAGGTPEPDDGTAEPGSQVKNRSTPGPSSEDEGPDGRSLDENQRPGSGGGGGFPLLAIAAIAAGVLVAGAGTSVFVASRSDRPRWR